MTHIKKKSARKGIKKSASVTPVKTKRAAKKSQPGPKKPVQPPPEEALDADSEIGAVHLRLVRAGKRLLEAEE